MAVQCEVVPLPPPRNGPGNVSLWILPARSAWAAPPFTMAANRVSPGTATNVAYNPTASAATAPTQVRAPEPPALQRSAPFRRCARADCATNDSRKQLTLIRAQITQAHMRADAARKAASFVSYTSINTSPAAFVEGVTDNNS